MFQETYLSSKHSKFTVRDLDSIDRRNVKEFLTIFNLPQTWKIYVFDKF